MNMILMNKIGFQRIRGPCFVGRERKFTLKYQNTVDAKKEDTNIFTAITIKINIFYYSHHYNENN